MTVRGSSHQDSVQDPHLPRPGSPGAQFRLLARLELARLFRRLDVLVGCSLLGLGALLLLAFGSKRPTAGMAAPGLWVGVLLASSLLASSLYEEERAHGFLETWLAGPALPEALFGAKLLRAWLTLAWIALLGHVTALLLFSVPPPASYPAAAAVDLLGPLGLAALAALFGTRARAASGTWLLAAASMPVAVPLVIACGRATDALHAGQLAQVWTWLGFLGGVDLLLVLLGLWLAPPLLGP